MSPSLSQAAGLAGSMAGIVYALTTSKGSLPWVILTEKGEEIKGQFTTEDLTEDIGGQWAQARTIGRKEPVLQYIGGQGHRISFNTRVWSQYQAVFMGAGEGHDVVPLVSKIKALAQPDPDLGRPPICLFTLGDDYSVEVVIESVGPVNYDEFTRSGKMRGASFSFTMLEYVEFNVEETGDEEPGDSLNYYVRVGDTFESVAKSVYGNPMLGVWLSQRNPLFIWPQPADRIRVPDKTKALRNTPNPASIPLSDDSISDVVIGLASERSRDYI